MRRMISLAVLASIGAACHSPVPAPRWAAPDTTWDSPPTQFNSALRLRWGRSPSAPVWIDSAVATVRAGRHAWVVQPRDYEEYHGHRRTPWYKTPSEGPLSVVFEFFDSSGTLLGDTTLVVELQTDWQWLMDFQIYRLHGTGWSPRHCFCLHVLVLPLPPETGATERDSLFISLYGDPLSGTHFR